MFFLGIGFWQNWVELMPVAWLARRHSLFVIPPFVAVPASILKLTSTSSAPTTLVGAHEKNARQRSSRRRTASRTRRRSETLRLIDRDPVTGTEIIQYLSSADYPRRAQ